MSLQEFTQQKKGLFDYAANFLLVCKPIPRTVKGWSSPKYSKWQFADRRDLKMKIEVGSCWEILTLRATVHVLSSKLLTEETLMMQL